MAIFEDIGLTAHDQLSVDLLCGCDGGHRHHWHSQDAKCSTEVFAGMWLCGHCAGYCTLKNDENRVIILCKATLICIAIAKI